MSVGDVDIDFDAISPRAWRLLRTAAGFEQRAVERHVDNVLQAHISMLENGNRGLSPSRLEDLFELYCEELSDEQIDLLIDHF